MTDARADFEAASKRTVSSDSSPARCRWPKICGLSGTQCSGAAVGAVGSNADGSMYEGDELPLLARPACAEHLEVAAARGGHAFYFPMPADFPVGWKRFAD